MKLPQWIFCCLLTLSGCVLGGCSAKYHRESVDKTTYQTILETQKAGLGKTEPFTINNPEEELRQRIMKTQPILLSHPASAGTQYLEPIEHWPNDGYLQSATFTQDVTDETQVIILDLLEALQVAARNSREYQSQKEQVFQEALNLDLAREEFRTSFFAAWSTQYELDRTESDDPGGIVTEGIANNFSPSFSKTFLSGAQLTAQLGWDLAMLLSPRDISSRGLFGDASLTIPLLRGAGRHIVAEPLTQAQRDMVYAIYEFERFKRSFVVDIADQYLSVLQRLDEVNNAEQNYRSLILSARRAQMDLRQGDISPVQVDQAYQDELSARNNWVSSLQEFAGAMDAFKLQLGLPVEANIELSREDFDRLAQSSESILADATTFDREEDIPAADAEIVLDDPTGLEAGRFDISPREAIELAFQNRLDLRVTQGQVYDAQRQVVIAADGLKTEITLFGSASTGQGRGIGSAGQLDAEVLDLDSGFYTALLNIDLPTERTAEAIAFRRSYIGLEQSVRSLQDLEDSIKLQIRNHLRTLQEERESLRIQARSVNLAEQRVESTNLNLQAGRIEIRDLLEAQEDLLSAQNALTAAMVNFRIAELELQRDLGVLEVNHEGIWTEYNPEVLNNETREIR